MLPELIVAKKEFKDYLTSRRLIAILAIMALFTIYGIYTGLNSYNMDLHYYKETKNMIATDSGIQKTIGDLRSLIASEEANGGSQEEINYLKETLDQYLNPAMPNLSQIFFKFNNYFVFIGMALSIILGFSLVSREKEEESFKLLLTRPIYRDTIINGKIIGAISVIILATGLTLLVTFAIMLIFGIIPTSNDLTSIMLSFVNMMLLCLVFLGISILVSTIVKNSIDSLIIIIAIVFFLYMVMTFALPITDFLTGPSPLLNSDNNANTISGLGSNNTTDSVPYTVSGILNPELVQYFNNRHMISEGINIISPIYNYNIISSAIITNQKPYVFSDYNPNPTVFDFVSLTWTNILSMLIEIIATFSLSYLLFMRMDV